MLQKPTELPGIRMAGTLPILQMPQYTWRATPIIMKILSYTEGHIWLLSIMETEVMVPIHSPHRERLYIMTGLRMTEYRYVV